MYVFLFIWLQKSVLIHCPFIYQPIQHCDGGELVVAGVGGGCGEQSHQLLPTLEDVIQLQPSQPCMDMANELVNPDEQSDQICHHGQWRMCWTFLTIPVSAATAKTTSPHHSYHQTYGRI